MPRSQAIAGLVDAGAMVDHVSPSGDTALIVAAAKGQIGALRALCECGAQVHLEPLPGKTALLQAVESDQQVRNRERERESECGAQVHLEPLPGKTALLQAVESDQQVRNRAVRLRTKPWFRRS
jgi:hypothetical protein